MLWIKVFFKLKKSLTKYVHINPFQINHYLIIYLLLYILFKNLFAMLKYKHYNNSENQQQKIQIKNLGLFKPRLRLVTSQQT